MYMYGSINVSVAGSSELAMASAVQKLADKTPGKEARAMEGFARALRQVRTERHKK